MKIQMDDRLMFLINLLITAIVVYVGVGYLLPMIPIKGELAVNSVVLSLLGMGVYALGKKSG